MIFVVAVAMCIVVGCEREGEPGYEVAPTAVAPTEMSEEPEEPEKNKGQTSRVIAPTTSLNELVKSLGEPDERSSTSEIDGLVSLKWERPKGLEGVSEFKALYFDDRPMTWVASIEDVGNADATKSLKRLAPPLTTIGVAVDSNSDGRSTPFPGFARTRDECVMVRESESSNGITAAQLLAVNTATLKRYEAEWRSRGEADESKIKRTIKGLVRVCEAGESVGLTDQTNEEARER